MQIRLASESSHPSRQKIVSSSTLPASNSGPSTEVAAHLPPPSHEPSSSTDLQLLIQSIRLEPRVIYELFDKRVAKEIFESAEAQAPGASGSHLAQAVEPSLSQLSSAVLKSHWEKLRKKFPQTVQACEATQIVLPPGETTHPQPPQPPAPPRCPVTPASSLYTWPDATPPITPHRAARLRADEVDELLDEDEDGAGAGDGDEDEDEDVLVSAASYRTFGSRC